MIPGLLNLNTDGRTDGQTGVVRQDLYCPARSFSPSRNPLSDRVPQKRQSNTGCSSKLLSFFPRAAIGCLEIGQLLISCENEFPSYMQDGLQRIDKKKHNV